MNLQLKSKKRKFRSVFSTCSSVSKENTNEIVYSIDISNFVKKKKDEKKKKHDYRWLNFDLVPQAHTEQPQQTKSQNQFERIH